MQWAPCCAKIILAQSKPFGELERERELYDARDEEEKNEIPPDRLLQIAINNMCKYNCRWKLFNIFSFFNIFNLLV